MEIIKKSKRLQDRISGFNGRNVEIYTRDGLHVYGRIINGKHCFDKDSGIEDSILIYQQDPKPYNESVDLVGRDKAREVSFLYKDLRELRIY